jgi:hypothetical protein
MNAKLCLGEKYEYNQEIKSRDYKQSGIVNILRERKPIFNYIHSVRVIKKIHANAFIINVHVKPDK